MQNKNVQKRLDNG